MSLGDNVIRDSQGGMAGKALAGVCTHDDEVGLNLTGSEQDFLNGGTKRYAEFGFAPVFAALGHELLHADDVDFTLAGNAFFSIGGGAFNHVEQAKSRTMFLGQGEGMSGCLFRAWAKISGEQNILKFLF